MKIVMLKPTWYLHNTLEHVTNFRLGTVVRFCCGKTTACDVFEHKHTPHCPKEKCSFLLAILFAAICYALQSFEAVLYKVQELYLQYYQP